MVNDCVGQLTTPKAWATVSLGPPPPKRKLMLRGDIDTRTHEDQGRGWDPTSPQRPR
jgi:hypothetical protein